MKPDFINPEVAFEAAIQKNILSDKESEPNFVGNFMYMHTLDKVDHFKNIVTRKYGHDQQSILDSCPKN